MKHLVCTLAVFLMACGGTASVPTLSLPAQAPSRDATPLQAAVEAFYTAKTPTQMRAAVRAAQAAGAESAPYHEIAAALADLEDRPSARIEHLLAALMDPANTQALVHLQGLADEHWTLSERVRVESVLGAVMAGHAQHDVRAFAAWMLGHARHLRGDLVGMRAALTTLGFRPPMAIIGTWDNDQGKGFDTEKPPERGLDLKGRYPGKLLTVGWRTAYPLDLRGKIDLGALLQPNQWQVAFAATGVEVSQAGRYELRIGTSDPIKVWVNDQEIFSGRRLSGWLFDGVVLPVDLRKGVNRVLIKSAQAKGSWLLTVRLTGAGGGPVAPGVLKAVAADTPYAAGAVSAPVEVDAMLARRVAALPKGSARQLHHLLGWADELGLRVQAVQAAEAFRARWADSLLGQFQQAMALWDNQERGRTADLLNALDQAYGDTLPSIALKQVRFWQQQKLNEKARTRLKALVADKPDRPSAYMALASSLGSEKWHEDRCQLLEAADQRWPQWPMVQMARARCLESLRLYPQASAFYDQIQRALPNDVGVLQAMHWLALGHDDYDAALTLATRITEAWPHLRAGWVNLAETHRRRGDARASKAAVAQLLALAPETASGHARLARLALEDGAVAAAVPELKAALARDPENESLANRLAYLAPEKAGPWLNDVPDEAALVAAVAARDSVQPADGTNVVYLLDDEVTKLGTDGSTINYVTMVAHAVNQVGRDNLTRMNVRRGGRHRILHAYAVDTDGRRVEASSIRGRTLRFRQLTVGSTVVLQYRIDERPDGYLASHLARQWWFQGPAVYTAQGRWVLWAPPTAKVLEDRLGAVEMAQSEQHGFLRTVWSTQNSAPMLSEPGMPPMSEVASHVTVSTVPDWETYWTWEKALLRDAFRESPELIELAKVIFEGAQSNQEKVDRIHAYLMTEIRYQQDYEGHIAGVKPHAAAVVMARQYGDCKDKAVLFITLASLANIEVHFALVRTRDAGKVLRAIPMQQFNHAIVYVPKQLGIEAGRFYDPTVDALDVDVLRSDDQGTWSLVYNPSNDAHQWRKIPFQAAEIDDVLNDAALTLGLDGSAKGEMTLSAKGRLGSILRRGARNQEQLGKMLEQQLGQTYPGARLVGFNAVQVTDVFQPARLQLALQTDALARREGNELRLRLPMGWSPQRYFTLSERRHPLLLGAPRQMRWRVAFELPEGVKVKRAPRSGAIQTDCLRLSRTVDTRKAGRVLVEQTVQITCARLAPEKYAAERLKVAEMQRLLDEELVLQLNKKALRAQALLSKSGK